MTDQKNTLLAIVLSAIVLIVWQYFFGLPHMQRQEAQKPPQTQTQTQNVPTPAPGTAPGSVPVPGQPAAAPAAQQPLTREAALRQSVRVPIDTPSIKGSISLKGGRIDDISLSQFHETVDPNSPIVVLLSPSESPQPFYAEFGWVAAAGSGAKPPALPGADTVWRQEGSGALTPQRPVVLTYSNNEGLTFRRTISVDDKYLFTVKDEVANGGTQAVTLFPYSLVSRHGTPPTLGYYILHEGLIGVLGDKGLQEITYKAIEDKKKLSFPKVTNAWLGITDKYWAAALLPDPAATLDAEFSASQVGSVNTYQTAYLLGEQVVAPGATGTATGRLFAGAKEVHVVNGYNSGLGLNLFDRLIDWGWFWFITKPMFEFMDWIFRLVGNFGVAILIVTVCIKGLFFPLANKSYASMAKMKAVQPQMQALRERFPDDKVKQQQELMELYKREKINPVAGCLPIVVQIPVFFSLYKVLFVTIEMRHAPFFGWIKDLSAPDPTNIFTLFGLIPFDPTIIPVIGSFLHLGIWPLIMGVTMWVQMKLNPAPPDPAQKVIFDWMPVIFTFMLSSFSAGLVIYWAWNNTLSVIQQSIIMKKNGAKIELFDNVKGLFTKNRPAEK
ncbi:MAG TPA: membrane protein insertase YidC [Xanthobacteraceae bacterium]|jgi:YidC/Oxa1 family membrane protein insertase|nr:membrane protein insertase YidC [Xanthobacteraceae bacterium]